MTPELEALAQRLEEAEKEIAHLASLIVEQSDANRTVVARSFVVTDAEGKRRAILGMFEDGPTLALSDGNGKVRADLKVNSEGAFLQLGDARGNEAVELSAEEYGPAIRLFRTDGKPGAAMLVTGLDMTSVSQIFLLDANGERRLKLALEADGPCLVFGKDNKVIWSAP